VRQLEIKVMNIIDARCNHEVYLMKFDIWVFFANLSRKLKFS